MIVKHAVRRMNKKGMAMLKSIRPSGDCGAAEVTRRSMLAAGLAAGAGVAIAASSASAEEEHKGHDKHEGHAHGEVPHQALIDTALDCSIGARSASIIASSCLEKAIRR